MSPVEAVQATMTTSTTDPWASQQLQVTTSVLQQRVHHLLTCIQPNAPSELRRLTIATYICDVIQRCFQQHHDRQVREDIKGNREELPWQ